MKKILGSLCCVLLIFSFAFAKSSSPEFEITKEIELLRSAQSDVETIMSEFDHDDTGEDDYDQIFRSEMAQIVILYSTGDCSEGMGFRNQPEWNVPEMTATKAVITFRNTTNLKDLGLKLSDFKKKLKDEKDEDSENYIYYNEKAGIIILTDEDEVEKIILHPLKKQIGKLCKNENNSEILSGETDFVDLIVNSENFCILRNQWSNVTELELQTKGVLNCKGDGCTDTKKEILVKTTAVDPENDVLTFNYMVSGGVIIGSGNEVIWDVTGVQPGTYSITAGSDDSCGVCGETKTREILVKENSYELIQLAEIKNSILDKTELIVGCPAGKLKRTLCPLGICGVSVTSVAAASKTKNLIFEYKISSGKIEGSGDHIVWNLTGLPPGKYSITAAASDNGTAFGSPETTTVEVKENPYCPASRK